MRIISPKMILIVMILVGNILAVIVLFKTLPKTKGTVSEKGRRGRILDVKGEELAITRLPSEQSQNSRRHRYLRCYPQGASLAHLIGFLIEGDGASGIERVRDGILQPGPGFDGGDVNLTIDITIQHIVEDQIAAVVGRQKPKSVFAVMADPGDGRILAMAQYPGFNPNNRAIMTPYNYRNRLIEDCFEPGGIFKPVIMALALDAGAVTPTTSIDCEHGMWKTYRLHDPHPHNELTCMQVLTQSSNIGMAKTALLLGNENLYNGIKRLGFGTSILRGRFPEASGIIHRRNRWDRLTPTRLAIGHSLLVTPLQILQAYCALANRGVMPRLHIISGRPSATSQKKGQIIQRSTASEITKMLEKATQDGIAGRAAISGISVAAMVGTAQKREETTGFYSKANYIAACAGFAPADAPQIALLVVVDEPKLNHHGNIVAAPAFQKITEKTLAYLKNSQGAETGETE